MSKYHEWINTALIVFVAVLVLGSGNDQPVSFSGSSDSGFNATGDGVFAVDGTTVIDGSGNVDAPITSTTGTFSGDVTITTSNSATSTITVGCIQMYATSTDTAVHLEFNTTSSTSTINGASNGAVAWIYGACPV